MSDEDYFRLAVVAIFGLSIAIAGYHRLQAARSGERISRRGEGRFIFFTLRGAAVILMICTVWRLIDPDRLPWARLPLSDPVRWAGLPLGLCAAALLYWALTSLGKNLTDTVAIRANHTLVTNGPYRFVRHPFYGATFLLVSATVLLTADGLIAFFGFLVFALLAIRSPIEEQKLIERFGDDYRRYADRTGRFLPRLW